MSGPDRPSQPPQLLSRDKALATLSHEIRTPLNGVLGMAGLLASTRLDETQRSYLETLRTCGDHLLNLVNDILDYAKLDSAKIELEPVEVDVETLLQGVAELLSPRAFGAGSEIVWWADPKMPTILADDGRLRQILFNLAGNALKFVVEGGVVLSAEVRGEAGGTVRLRFTVADTGPGLEPGAESKIFEEFVQTEAGARAGGAGLGLAIVKRLVEAFDGELGVESRPSEGARFWFEAGFKIARRAPAPRPLTGRSVLVVSPSRVVREAAVRQIEASGGEAAAAQDLRACPPADVLLIDGALRRVRPPKGRTAVILLAPEERRRIGRARAAGYAGYLVKPLRRESLAARLLAVLGQVEGRPDAGGLDERAAPAATSGARVLLVEDNPVNALLAKALLNREGCAVERAGDGKEALEAAARSPFDLILMDLRLPDGDGRAVAAELRRRGIKTPIAALTANSFEDDRQACIAAGMDDFLSKPLSPPELRAALRRWVRDLPLNERARAVG